MDHAHPEKPSLTRPRNRFAFFVGRKRSANTRRSGSVRRKSSVRNSVSITTKKHARRPSLAVRGQLHQISELTEADKASRIHNRPTLLLDTMTKDSDLPPLPQEAQASTSPESQKQGGLFKRFTSKLRSTSHNTHHASMSNPSSSTSQENSEAPKRRKTLHLPTMPKPHSNQGLTNAFTSHELRQQALRERGLIPAVPHPYKDSHGYMLPLSDQEKYLDNRFTTVLEEKGRQSGDENQDSEAKRIREAWLKKNQDAEAGPSSSLSPPEPPSKDEASECALAPTVLDDTLVTDIQQIPIPPSTLPVPDSTEKPPTIPTTLTKKLPKDIPLPPSPLPDQTTVELEVSEKVALWLQSTPTGSPRSEKSFGKARRGPVAGDGLPAIREDDSSPSSTAPSTVRAHKDIPPPVSITSFTFPSPSSLSPSTTEFGSIQSSPTSESLASPSPPIASVRGRSLTVGNSFKSTNTSLAASLSTSTSSSGSRARSKVPALSPTRTTSSSATSEVPSTPTLASQPRISFSSSGSQLSDAPQKNAKLLPNNPVLTIQTAETGELAEHGLMTMATIIVESPLEDSCGGVAEFGQVAVLDFEGSPGSKANEESLPTPRPRPARQTTHETQERRKSINFSSMFNTKSHTLDTTAPERSGGSLASRSMGNLRRSVAGTIVNKFRPKSTLLVDTSISNGKRTVNTSNLPPSPRLTPLPTSPDSLSPTPRLRTGLNAPIYTRDSLLMDLASVEDDESRRLSEMAFLL
ncbi:hypothetical protein C8Q75DRAFT_810346 [Abortiporus biennis]|nr:hypothetical protein C8Q75DRAFT_810346 [Abortiporus biennis]